LSFISTVHLADEGTPLCKNANKCKIDLTIHKGTKKNRKSNVFNTIFLSEKTKKPVTIEYLYGETGISAYRNWNPCM